MVPAPAFSKETDAGSVEGRPNPEKRAGMSTIMTEMGANNIVL